MTAFFSGGFGLRSCYRALWLTPPSYRHPLHVTPDSERMRSSSASLQRLSMSSGSNSHLLRSYLGAGWTSVFSRGAIKLLQLLSHPLMALKKKDMSTCLLWMSLWPHVSARPQLLDGRRGRAICPSHAEPHLHSLDGPTRRLDKRLQDSASLRDLRTWLYAPPKPPPKPSGFHCPAW